MKLIRGLYGHGNKGGKLYSYLAPDRVQVGQRVVAPARNWISGKIHDTMFTIKQTNSADSPYAVAEIDRLGDMVTKGGRDVQLRHIRNSDIMELPGASQYGSKSWWTRESKEQYRSDVNYRLMESYAPKDTELARARLLGG